MSIFIGLALSVDHGIHLALNRYLLMNEQLSEQMYIFLLLDDKGKTT